MDYANEIAPRVTGQRQRAIGRDDQIKNSEGGFVFQTSTMDQVRRFLIIGSEQSSFYISSKKLVADNARNLISAIKTNGIEVVEMIADISFNGLAAKNDPAIFALCLCMSEKYADYNTRAAAAHIFPKVCRISSHVFLFCQYIQHFRGWGRVLRDALSSWYLTKTIDTLQYQLIKYPGRITVEGKKSSKWTHRDVLRKCHPTPMNDTMNICFKWATNKELTEEEYSRVPIIRGSMMIKNATTVSEVCHPITEHAFPREFIPKQFMNRTEEQSSHAPSIRGSIMPKNATAVSEVCHLITEFNLPREVIPKQFMNDTEVLSTLARTIPITALFRSLVTFGVNNVLDSGSMITNHICERLTDEKSIQKSRIHPIQVLSALVRYETGMSRHGSFTPRRQVEKALNKAFYLSFKNVKSSGKRTMISIDVSGSMDWAESTIPSLGITASKAAAAMAMVTYHAEPNCMVTVFSHNLEVANINIDMSISDVMRKIGSYSMGRTDCALPMLYALREQVNIDTFIVYTDNETWCGNVHPFDALKQYRQASGIDARLVVVGMVANDFTIADPTDPGMLDVVGFDASAPAIISEFSSRKF